MEPSAVTDHIGGFDLIREMASGGVGSVHLARHRRSGDYVVLKLLHAHMADVEGCRERFRREAELGLRIHHRNVVSTMASGEDNGVPYLVIEHLDGLPFDTVLKRAGTLPWATAMPIAASVADGLGHLHRLQIIHRDIKPGNLYLCRDGRCVILDLVLAKPMGWDDIDVDVPPVASDQAWTVTGGAGVMGTPAYMAPEQATDPNSVQPAADIHALGATIFQWLSGALPRPRCSDPINAMAQLVNRPPDSLASVATEIPASISAVVDRMLHPDAEARPEDGEAAAVAIREALTQADMAPEPARGGSVWSRLGSLFSRNS